ncbi:hypothetical protein [Rhodococcus qingshengii]|uniref:hypothetical protein n=1 Tax=Rhodococcus qingshengii TaxID=334542 RepID=UPI0007E5A252|nr:hypothetical protein [Rhodococcus qingshengii]
MAGNTVPIPAIIGRTPTPTTTSTHTTAQMLIKHVVDYAPTFTEQHVLEDFRPRQPATTRPVAKYQLRSLSLDKPSTITRDDVVVATDAGYG